jgi:pimeloyl-ACP methyl ester carboxylesterase
MSRAHLAAAAVAALALVGAACASSSSSAKSAPTTATTTNAPTSTAAAPPAGPSATATTPATSSAPTPSSTGPSSTGPSGAGTTGAPGVGASLPLPAPAGDAFYTPPSPLPGTRPGDLIWYRTTTGAPAGTSSWQILYRSTSATGAPIAVSGTVIAKPNAAPAAPVPVLTYAHGSTGLGDQCAPSRQFAAGQSQELSLLSPIALGRGMVFVATDYEGLGTPGDHTYVVGRSEGQAVIDAARAVQRLPGLGVTAASPVVILGHSQGGGAAAWAGELAPTYAPDLPVKGAVAGAPAAELAEIVKLASAQDTGLELMTFVGFAAAYPELHLDQVLTPAGLADAERIRTECVGQIESSLAGTPLRSLEKVDPFSVPAFATRIAENTPGNEKTTVPMFVYQGDADEVIPVQISKDLLTRECRTGNTVLRKTYPNATHTSVILAAANDILAWVSDRLAGVPAPSSC